MAIDALAAESERVRSVDLADALGVARASVCKAMDRLTEGGYAVRGGGGGLRLTEKGCEVVKNYAPARRLVRSMFADKLGLPAQRAERESLAGARSAERGYGQKDSAPLRRRRGEKVICRLCSHRATYC